MSPTPSGKLESLNTWLDTASLGKLVLAYILTMVVIGILSIAIFFFPIAPIYQMLGRDFSSLGPLATFSWGICINLLAVTPFFFVLFVRKIRGRKSGR